MSRAERRLREDAFSSELPILDEFTESFQEGRPILPKVEQTIVTTFPHVPLPEGITLEQPLQPLRCWDNRGFEHAADKCDSLYSLTQTLKSKLSLFQNCREKLELEETAIVLRFFVEADFVRNTLSFWPDTHQQHKKKIELLSCVSDALADLPIKRLLHRHGRYRLVGKIKMAGPKPADIATVAATQRLMTEETQKQLDQAITEAKEVMVSRERVRVRKAPVDGEIIGFISKPAKVRLIEKSDEWCLVKTKRGNIGWMVCWGLSTDDPNVKKADTAAEEKGDAPKSNENSASSNQTPQTVKEESTPASTAQ